MIILGGGITGLSAGISTGGEIYEAREVAGGICTSYYLTPDKKKSFSQKDENSYRFEIGGGHWIFGNDRKILDFLYSLENFKQYQRKASIYLPDMELFIPYPIQYHLSYFPKSIRNKSLKEILNSEYTEVSTLKEWLELYFGPTLCELFFFPFHQLYTDGLYKEIAPQDKFKTPVDKELIIIGAKGDTPPVGYNTTFIYPVNGLDALINKMAKKCKLNLKRTVAKINIKRKEIEFLDGAIVKYEKIISTLPLNFMLKITDSGRESNVPYTSVIVINIGGQRGESTPDDHWVYIPKSKAGFHRVGFYSNVDKSFLPDNNRKDRVNIYVEKAYRSGKKPTELEIKRLVKEVIEELQKWKFIGKEIDVVDTTWIDIAYTWQYPDSNWREDGINFLKKNDIYQIGRYGKWQFQGIMESIKDGLEINV